MANITTTEFAAHLETDGRTARKFLRSITPKDEQPGKGARWVIEGNKRSLNTMKKNFDKWHTAQVEEKAARAAEKELGADGDCPETDAEMEAMIDA